MIPIIDNYPVFEADQVLSQKHLNQLINYLEEQDRASRTSLLGMGIACGLKISKPNATTVAVGCGTGITSLGYLVNLPNSVFTHFKEITLSENFLHPDTEKHPYLENLYQYTGKYEPLETSIELLTSEADDADKLPLTEAMLNDKVVILLVEILLIDEKNCVSIDCADKGKRLDFKTRALLVPSNLLANTDAVSDLGFDLNSCSRSYLDPLSLPRFNVPKNSLTTGTDILNAYNLVIGSAISGLNNAISAAHDLYANQFSELDNYIRLNNVSGRITTVHTQNQKSIHLQYVWDWMHDLAATYNQIVQFHTCYPGLCCPDKGRFPFHLLLGPAEFATEEILPENDLLKFRTPFIKTGILTEEEREQKIELKGLLEKLIRLIGTFDLNLAVVQNEGIKITPSCIGKVPLSERAIPYYYSEIEELNAKWSPVLSLKSQNSNILSYHSGLYSSAAAIVNPLAYDLENYNFFRVEGHIGAEYTEALTQITALQQQNGLPFKVVGINAVDDTGRTVALNNVEGIWDDLEVEYKLAKTKLINTTEFIINWLTDNKNDVQESYSRFTDAFLESLKNTISEFRKLLTENLNEFIENYSTFYLALEKLNDIFLFHNNCIDLVQSVNDSSAILQEIENRLDEFHALVLEDPFTVIYREAERRWIRAIKATFLSEFLKKHPGINHKAGVAKGGTLVLVYSDYSIFQTESSPVYIAPLFFGFANTHIAMFDYSDSQIQAITRNNVLSKRKIHYPFLINTVTADDCQQSVVNYQNTLTNYVTTNFTPAVASYINTYLQPVYTARPDAPVNDTGVQRKIIADFYLPYICCSDGDNINLVINPAEPITADFDAADFDGNDFFTNET